MRKVFLAFLLSLFIYSQALAGGGIGGGPIDAGSIPATTVLSTTITDGDLTHAPDGNSVFDALAGKSPLAGSSSIVTVGTVTSGNVDAAVSAARFASPGVIGGTTPSTSYFTDLYLYGADVDHGVTSIAATHYYGSFFATSALNGGLSLFGISDTDATGLTLTGIMGTDNPTDNLGALFLRGSKKNGTGYQALGNAETVIDFYNYTTTIGRVYGNGEWVLTSLQNTPVGSVTASTGTFTTLTGNHKEEVEAASDNIGAIQCRGNIINNYGQAADATLTLPTAVVGLNFTVILGTTVAKYFRLDPQAGDSIYLDGITTGDGKYVGVPSATIGNSLSCATFQTGATPDYDWLCSTIAGAWAAE